MIRETEENRPTHSLVIVDGKKKRNKTEEYKVFTVFTISKSRWKEER